MLGEIRKEVERGEPVQSGSPKAVRVSASLLADGDLPGRPWVWPLTPLGMVWISPPALRNAAICSAGTGWFRSRVRVCAWRWWSWWPWIAFPSISRTGHYTDLIKFCSAFTVGHFLKRFRNHRADALVFNEAAYLGITTPHHRRTFMLRQAIRTTLCGRHCRFVPGCR